MPEREQYGGSLASLSGNVSHPDRARLLNWWARGRVSDAPCRGSAWSRLRAMPPTELRQLSELTGISLHTLLNWRATGIITLKGMVFLGGLWLPEHEIEGLEDRFRAIRLEIQKPL